MIACDAVHVMSQEPFSILPLEYWATKAETSLLQMLRYENAFPATMVDPKGMRMESALDPVIGSDAVPISSDALSESISKGTMRDTWAKQYKL